LEAEMSHGHRDGEGRAEVPILHPWDYDKVSGRGYPGKPKVTLENHLDGQGRKRLFRLTESHGPLGSELVAEEIRDDEPTGWSFKMRFDPELDVPPYRDLRVRIGERLAVRDIVRDPDTGVPEILDRLVHARIVAPQDPDAPGPDVIVDGDRLTWAEFGKALLPYEGWGVRAELFEGGEE
jgi:hypothetical protein